jgi:hemerythrin-like domain-containing protein
MVHEPIRADLLRLQDALKPEYFDGTIEWKVNTFFDVFDRFAKFLHNHHDAEEHFFFPALSTKGKLDSKLTEEHKTIVKHLDEIPKMREEFVKAKDSQAQKLLASKLRDSIGALSKEVVSHLDFEETIVDNELKARWTRDEWENVSMEMQKTLSIVDGRWQLGSFIYHMKIWGGDEAVARFQHQMPAPVKALMNNLFEPEFRLDYLGQIDSISANKKRSTTKELALKIALTFAALLIFGSLIGLRRLFVLMGFLLGFLLFAKTVAPYLPPILMEAILVVLPIIEGQFEDFLVTFGA